jgi:uncharacterized protein (TIGR03083 family)
MTGMPVSRLNSDLANGALAAYEDFAQLIAGLDGAAWQTHTRCSDWEVRDVAGHVVGLAHDAATGVPGSRNADEQAAALRDHSPTELAEQLRATVATLRSLTDVLDDAAWSGPSGVPDRTLAQGVQGLWFDTYVHRDDIASALDTGTDRGPGLAGSVAYLAFLLEGRGWGPATLAFEGLPQHDIGGGGEKVGGDPHDFVLVASGRADPATLGLDPSVNVYA